ncbi:MAG: hypothetical protein WKG03_21675 [Telluria sp.]
MDILAQIRSQLVTRRGQWPSICEATGLNYWWITKFAQGRIADPASQKIAKLTAHLSDLDAGEAPQTVEKAA